MSPASVKTRQPLENTTNGYRTSTSPPPVPTAKCGPVLRHKESERILHPQLDSSESWPSPHSSIYQASAPDVSTENCNWYDAREWGTPKKPEHGTLSIDKMEIPAWENNVLDTDGSVVPASFLQDTPSPKKHTPHKLYPITEQNSLATLRTGASFSTLKGQSSGTSLRPVTPGLNGKKRKSFSLSDLPPSIQPVAETKPPLPPSTPLPAPIEPCILPPVRIPTPPGLPKFNDPTTSNYRLPPPDTRFRDRFRPPTAAEREWVAQTVGLPRGVVMRGQDGTMVRSRFIPIKSGHFPPQRQAHAIMRVREGTNEDAAASLPARPVMAGQTQNNLTRPGIQPGSQIQDSAEASDSRQGKKNRKWERVWEKVCWFVGCCGFCEDVRKRTGPTKSRSRSAPLFLQG